MDALVEYVKDYSTKINGETFTGIQGLAMRGVIHQSETIWAAQGLAMRGVIHQSETIWAAYKADMDDGDVFDDTEDIWETCNAWVPNQGNGKRSKKAVTASKSKLESLTDAEKVEYLMAQGIVFTD